MADSFLFYDLETFGQDPRRTRIAQYAAIRTDSDLNEIDTPVSFFVRPADDLLPSPMATMVTGITRSRRWPKASAKPKHSIASTSSCRAPAPARWVTTPCASTTSSSATACSATSTTRTNASGATVIRAGTCWTCCG